MKRNRAYASFVMVAMLLCCLHIFPAQAASYDWSKPRPSTGTIYDEKMDRRLGIFIFPRFARQNK